MRAVLGYKASGPSDALALMRLAVRRFEWNVPEGEVAGQSYADDLSDLPLSEFDNGLLLSAVRALERQGTA